MEIVESPGFSRSTRDAAWTLGSLILLLAWDAGGLDLTLARLAGGEQGFPLRDHWALTALLHQWPRQLALLAGLWLVAGVWWPTGVLRHLSRAGRLQWLGSALLGLAVVNVLKHSSQTSCPWDLAAFGGLADHLSHWAWGQRDGGPGHCFPAGHASAGFAFLGGYFALRRVSGRRAAQCLAAALSAGMVLGLAQQLRGAHFMSHTLWTGWLCWTSAWAMDSLLKRGWPVGIRRPLP
jgi:membrane-associated PAP2 superfamily phosphatase